MNKSLLISTSYILSFCFTDCVHYINLYSEFIGPNNPQGAIVVRLFKISTSFWKHKRDQFDYFAAVDGAWGMINDSNLGGSIGGFLKDRSGKTILSFSGPVSACNASYTELEGVLQVIYWLLKNGIDHKRVVICSDSSEVVSAFNEGIFIKFPLKRVEFEFQHRINKSIFIHFVPRYLNEQADDLAKKGLSRPNLKEFEVGQINLLDCPLTSSQLYNSPQ